MLKFSDFVHAPAIVPALKGATRDEVITEMVDALVEAKAVRPALRDTLVKLILDREKKGSTGFGKGVAVPHVKHKDIEKMVAAIAISQSGVDFRALDKEPVYSIVLLLSPADRPEQHLQAMENIFSHLQKDTFRRFLRQATTTEAVIDLIQEADAQQLLG